MKNGFKCKYYSDDLLIKREALKQHPQVKAALEKIWLVLRHGPGQICLVTHVHLGVGAGRSRLHWSPDSIMLLPTGVGAFCLKV